MRSALSLSHKIRIALVFIAVILLTSTLGFSYYEEKKLANSFVERNLENIALNYFDSVNTMMLTGTMANRKLLQTKILSQENIVEARIIRGDQVKKLYGAGFADQNAISTLEKNALKGIKAFNIIETTKGRQIEFVLPVKAQTDNHGTNCIACHQAKENQVLGAVKITYDLTSTDAFISSSIAQTALIQLATILICFSILSAIFSRLILRRLSTLKEAINHTENNLDLTSEIPVLYQDELGAVSHALNKMMTKFKDSFINVSGATEHLIKSAQDVDNIAELTKDAVLTQKSGTNSVAAAINELDASANEVRENTSSAAKKSELANRKASESLTLIDHTKSGIIQLRDQVIENTSMITQLSAKTVEVGSVLDVITSIAEQTNLLALNAAIEAARAGEQGRGFAVVADEVRSLATRTRDSIDQIQKTISDLQIDAKVAVESMEDVNRQATDKANEVVNVSTLLVEITSQIRELDSLNSQIAHAAQQQNLAADEININVVNISDVADKSSEDAIKGKQISEHLLNLAYELNQQVSIFKLH